MSRSKFKINKNLREHNVVLYSNHLCRFSKNLWSNTEFIMFFNFSNYSIKKRKLFHFLNAIHKTELQKTAIYFICISVTESETVFSHFYIHFNTDNQKPVSFKNLMVLVTKSNKRTLEFEHHLVAWVSKCFVLNIVFVLLFFFTQANT